MEIIEQIGSYAGLAAIVGLAVLSALYFSQARDLRRLREAEDARGAGAVPEQPAQAPGPRRPTAATVPAQGAVAAARQEKRPDAPTQARPAPVAGEDASAGAAGKRAAPAASAPAGAGAPASANSTGAVTGPGGADPSETQVASAQGGAAADRPAQRPAPSPLPPARPGATAAALRSASPPAVKGAGLPWYRSLPLRYLALIVAGVVVVSAGALYAATSLMGESDGASGADVASEQPDGGDAAAPLDPSTITVAVLNGTEVAGLAGQIADSVEAAGFQRGNVSNAPEQAGAAESAVLFAEGARRAARQVGQELGIAQIEPLDEESRVLAGTADVVVILGADKAE